MLAHDGGGSDVQASYRAGRGPVRADAGGEWPGLGGLGSVGILQKFENRLEQMVSGVFAKAFRSAVQPVKT